MKYEFRLEVNYCTNGVDRCESIYCDDSAEEMYKWMEKLERLKDYQDSHEKWNLLLEIEDDGELDAIRDDLLGWLQWDYDSAFCDLYYGFCTPKIVLSLPGDRKEALMTANQFKIKHSLEELPN